MAAGDAEDVVHPLGGLAVIDVVGEVLADLALDRRHIILERALRDEVGDLVDHVDVFALEVDLLKVAVQVAVEGRDRSVRRLPGGIDDHARVRQLLPDRIDDDPVELAPPGLMAIVLPRDGDDGAVLLLGRHLTGPDLVRFPVDRPALLLRLPLDGAVEGVGAELGLEELVGGPLQVRQGVIPHQLGEDPAGLLAGVGEDVEPLEVIGVAGIGLDLRLGRRTRQRQRTLGHALGTGDLDDLADLAEAGQVLRAEVQHRHLVTEGSAHFVDGELVVGAVAGVLDRLQPVRRAFLVDVDAESVGRLVNTVKCLGVLLGHRSSSFYSWLDTSSATIARNRAAWSRASARALWVSGAPPR